MFRRVLTLVAFCLAAVSVGEVSAQDRKARQAGTPDASMTAHLVEPKTIQELQLATLGKYRGTLVESPVVNRPKANRRRQADETLRDEMSNSFIVGGGYNFQRVDDLPVNRLQGVFATGFYYPVSWLGIGGEYQYGTGTVDTVNSSNAVVRQDKLTRHAVVLGPEFSGYPGDRVRLFFHPLFGWAKDKARVTTGNASVTSEQTNLAVNLGGGLDVRLNRTFLLRAFQFDYLGIKRDTFWQNNWRLAAGIAVRPH